MHYIEVKLGTPGYWVFETGREAQIFKSQEQLHTYLGQRGARKVYPGQTAVEGTYLTPTQFVANIAVK